jgi:hypothetical protein
MQIESDEKEKNLHENSWHYNKWLWVHQEEVVILVITIRPKVLVIVMEEVFLDDNQIVAIAILQAQVEEEIYNKHEQEKQVELLS